uniref:Transposase (putative) gypsy type domain-containing protein n=1 Tax=Setaria italica TaxID=4555 RepID=K4AIX0_SETIT
MEVDAPSPEPHDPAATSDAGGGAGIPCWAEEVGGMKSSHDSEEMLLSLCRNYGVGEDYKPLLAKDGWVPWKTMPEGSNIICVFDSMLEVGVQFPLHDFYVNYLRHYSIAPSQLTPNAWRYLVGFVQLCDGVGVPPTVAVFQHYFNFKMCPNGWYYIVASPSRRLFKPDARLPSNEGWKKKFFFLESLSSGLPWRCPEKWGTPEPASFADPELTDAEKKAIERLESEKEKWNVSLMELLHKAEPNADAAASMPPPKKKFRSLGAITSPPPEQLAIATESSPPPDLVTPERPSHGDGGEHYSASRILMDAYKAVQRTEEELHNAKDELRKERAKHAAHAARMEEALGAAKAEHTADAAQLKEKLQAAEAEHAKTLGFLGQERVESKVLWENLEAAKAEHATVVGRLKDELQAEKEKRMAKVHQLTEDLHAAEAEHAAKVKAVRAECQLKVINAEHTSSTRIDEMLSKRYAAGLRAMRDFAIILYPSIDPARLTPEALTAGSVPPGFPPRQAPADQ